MKKIKLLLTLTLLTSMLAGCLQVETTVKVEKDGSGTINETVLFSKNFVKMVRDFVEAFKDSASTEEFSMFEESKIKQDAINFGVGVKYVSHEVIKNDDWEGYQAIYVFDDITKVKLTPDPESKVDLDENETAVSPEDYYYFSFVRGDTPELIIDRPEIEFESNTSEDNDDSTQVNQNDDEAGEEFMKLMEGMKIDIAVEVEGEIVNTNASYVQGSKVTLFQMDLSEMMKNKDVFNDFKKNEPQNIDELKFYLEKLGGLKIQVEKPVTIKFE